jgi:hypothetical protein
MTNPIHDSACRCAQCLIAENALVPTQSPNAVIGAADLTDEQINALMPGDVRRSAECHQAKWRKFARDVLAALNASPSVGVPVTRDTLRIGGRYNWKGQPERLVYMGLCEPRNGCWHQFAKVEAPTVCWSEVTDADLSSFEETVGVPDSAATRRRAGLTLERNGVMLTSRRTAPSTPTPPAFFTKDRAMTNDTHHSEVLTSIDADMLALANRIAASCAPEDERGEIAMTIARHLKLGWPAAETHHDTAVCDAAYQSAISEVAALKTKLAETETKLGIYVDWCNNMNTGPIEHF